MVSIRKYINKNIEIIIFFILSVCLAIYIGYRYVEKFEEQKLKGINQIDGIVYINLENRGDRKELLIKELESLDTDMSKVNKVSGVFIPKNGHKGCVQSHILALNLAKMNQWGLTLVLEDDAQLNVTPKEFNDIIDLVLEKMNNKNWDVIMLAGANKVYDDKDNSIEIMIDSIEVKDEKEVNIKKTFNIKKINGATTSSAYIIKQGYLDTLLEVFNQCNKNMERSKLSGNNYENNALDQQWRVLQEKDFWYILDNDLIRQRAIWSTIMKESHQ